MFDHRQVMKELWTKDVAEYEGETFKLEPSWQWPKPTQKPYPPILVAGAGPNIIKRVVALGDGWLPVVAPVWDESMRGNMTNLAELPDMIAEARRLEEEAGVKKTTITTLGLPSSPEFIDKAMELGIERMLFTLPSDEPQQAFDLLGAYGDAIKPYLK